MVVLFCTTNTTFLLQSSDTPKNYGFVRWVDPPPIHPHQDYIYYLQNHIFDLEREVSSGKTDVEEDGNNNGGGSQEPPCCNYSCHQGSRKRKALGMR